MTQAADALAQLRAINAAAAFNRWCGIEVMAAEPGRATIAMPWRAEVGQYSGFLHAGLVGALIDTACGFAAATQVGRVLASHYAVNCLRPAVGELFAESGGSEKLVATGDTLLLVVPAGAEA